MADDASREGDWYRIIRRNIEKKLERQARQAQVEAGGYFDDDDQEEDTHG